MLRSHGKSEQIELGRSEGGRELRVATCNLRNQPSAPCLDIARLIGLSETNLPTVGAAFKVWRAYNGRLAEIDPASYELRVRVVVVELA